MQYQSQKTLLQNSRQQRYQLSNIHIHKSQSYEQQYHDTMNISSQQHEQQDILKEKFNFNDQNNILLNQLNSSSEYNQQFIKLNRLSENNNINIKFIKKNTKNYKENHKKNQQITLKQRPRHKILQKVPLKIYKNQLLDKFLPNKSSKLLSSLNNIKITQKNIKLTKKQQDINKNIFKNILIQKLRFNPHSYNQIDQTIIKPCKNLIKNFNKQKRYYFTQNYNEVHKQNYKHEQEEILLKNNSKKLNKLNFLNKNKQIFSITAPLLSNSVDKLLKSYKKRQQSKLSQSDNFLHNNYQKQSSYNFKQPNKNNQSKLQKSMIFHRPSQQKRQLLQKTIQQIIELQQLQKQKINSLLITQRQKSKLLLSNKLNHCKKNYQNLSKIHSITVKLTGLNNNSHQISNKNINQKQNNNMKKIQKQNVNQQQNEKNKEKQNVNQIQKQKQNVNQQQNIKQIQNEKKQCQQNKIICNEPKLKQYKQTKQINKQQNENNINMNKTAIILYKNPLQTYLTGIFKQITPKINNSNKNKLRKKSIIQQLMNVKKKKISIKSNQLHQNISRYSIKPAKTIQQLQQFNTQFHPHPIRKQKKHKSYFTCITQQNQDLFEKSQIILKKLKSQKQRKSHNENYKIQE